MLKLSDEQFIFSKNVAVFLHWLTVHHIKWTIGEVWRRAPAQKWLLKKGWTKVLKGQHTKKKAIDLSIYIEDSLYVPLRNIIENYDIISHIGLFWKSLHPKNVWGGDWLIDEEGNFKENGFVDLFHFEMKD